MSKLLLLIVSNYSLQRHFSDDMNDLDYTPGFDESEPDDCDDNFIEDHAEIGQSSTTFMPERKKRKKVIDKENNCIVIKPKRKKNGTLVMKEILIIFR
jgi:hypothetical protein